MNFTSPLGHRSLCDPPPRFLDLVSWWGLKLLTSPMAVISARDIEDSVGHSSDLHFLHAYQSAWLWVVAFGVLRKKVSSAPWVTPHPGFWEGSGNAPRLVQSSLPLTAALGLHPCFSLPPTAVWLWANCSPLWASVKQASHRSCRIVWRWSQMTWAAQPRVTLVNVGGDWDDR